MRFIGSAKILALFCIIVACSPLVACQAQTHEAALSPGWDVFSEPLSSGKVLWTVLDNGKLQVSFELKGASPNHKFVAGAHFFKPSGSGQLPGVCQFGGLKISCDSGPLAREGITATGLGAWDFGTLDTNGNGDGIAQFNLAPPAGSYYVQFTVRMGECNPSGGITGGCPVAYRTGAKMGVGFEAITIPSNQGQYQNQEGSQAMNFHVSPSVASPGSEVSLYLSQAGSVGGVYFNGRALPKKTSPDGKVIVVPVPGDAQTGYFELLYNGQMVKSQNMLTVTPVSGSPNRDRTVPPSTASGTTSGGSSEVRARAPASKGVLWQSNGNSYEAVLVPGGVTWADAKAQAEAKGGHLVTIASSEESNFVYNLVSGDDRYWISESWGSGTGPWIGLRRSRNPSSNGWEWVAGELMTSGSYANWAPGEPNNANENVVVLSGHTPSGRALKGPAWDDVGDSKKQNGYIVEYESGGNTGGGTSAGVPPINGNTIQKRISGQKFLEFDKKDNQDYYDVINGFIYVSHNPGCGIRGNDGNDWFFRNKPLPPNCKIESLQVIQVNPNDKSRIESALSQNKDWGTSTPGASNFIKFLWGPIDIVTPFVSLFDSKAGSYGVWITKESTKEDPSICVHWENTCWGDYSGMNVDYLATFIISAPNDVVLEDYGGIITVNPGGVYK